MQWELCLWPNSSAFIPDADKVLYFQLRFIFHSKSYLPAYLAIIPVHLVPALAANPHDYSRIVHTMGELYSDQTNERISPRSDSGLSDIRHKAKKNLPWDP